MEWMEGGRGAGGLRTGQPGTQPLPNKYFIFLITSHVSYLLTSNRQPIAGSILKKIHHF